MRVFLAIILLSIMATSATSAKDPTPVAEYTVGQETIDNSMSDAYSAKDNHLELDETEFFERLESLRRALIKEEFGSANKNFPVQKTEDVDSEKVTKYITRSDRVKIDGEDEAFHIIVELEINASGRKFNKQFITSDLGRVRYSDDINETNENALDLTMRLYGKSLYSGVDLKLNSRTKTSLSPFLPNTALTRCQMEIGQVMTYNTPHFFDFGSCNITVTLHTGQDLMVIGSAQLQNK